jgi:DNA-binding PadR family transcriptional regulator
MADVPRSRLDLVALAALAVLTEGHSHPYEIQRLFRERHKDFAIGPPRALYHAIARLEQRGLVRAIETSREGRRPERTVYGITEEGREEIAAWVCELIESPVPEHPVFTAAMSLVGVLPVPRVAQALKARAVHLEGRIAGGKAAERMLLEEVGLPRVFLLESDLGLRLLEAELAWCRAVIDDITAGRLHWETHLPDTEIAKSQRGHHS